MKNYRAFAVLAVLLVVIGSGFLWHSRAEAPATADLTLSWKADYEHRSVTLGKAIVDAAIADTDATRELGLGGVTRLTDSQGMLFIFDHDDSYAFWMKGMVIPIDMIWFDSGKRVIYVAQNVDPSTYPQSFGPQEPSRYVLEVDAGWTERYNVHVGDRAAW